MDGQLTLYEYDARGSGTDSYFPLVTDKHLFKYRLPHRFDETTRLDLGTRSWFGSKYQSWLWLCKISIFVPYGSY